METLGIVPRFPWPASAGSLVARKPSASCLGFLGRPPPALERPPSRRPAGRWVGFVRGLGRMHHARPRRWTFEFRLMTWRRSISEGLPVPRETASAASEGRMPGAQPASSERRPWRAVASVRRRGMGGPEPSGAVSRAASASCLAALGRPPPARWLHGNPRHRASVSLAGLRRLSMGRPPDGRRIGGQPHARGPAPRLTGRGCRSRTRRGSRRRGSSGRFAAPAAGGTWPETGPRSGR